MCDRLYRLITVVCACARRRVAETTTVCVGMCYGKQSRKSVNTMYNRFIV